MCEHSCLYCFMKRNRPLPPLRLEEKELKVNLGEGNFIFVGSTDEWAANVPSEWIEQVLDYCDVFDNRYLFQSKNPARFLEYLDHPVMKKSVLCTTIETNRFYPDIMRNRLTLFQFYIWNNTVIGLFNNVKKSNIRPLFILLQEIITNKNLPLHSYLQAFYKQIKSSFLL